MRGRQPWSRRVPAIVLGGGTMGGKSHRRWVWTPLPALVLHETVAEGTVGGEVWVRLNDSTVGKVAFEHGLSDTAGVLPATLGRV